MTGYTAAIADGISFKQFAMNCTRAMALTLMRDDPADAPIPNEFKPSTYNAEQVDAAKAEIGLLLTLTENDLQKLADKDYEENLADERTALASCQELRTKYEASPVSSPNLDSRYSLADNRLRLSTSFWWKSVLQSNRILSQI